MKVLLLSLFPLLAVSLEVDKAPVARGMGPPDSDLLRQSTRPHIKRKRAGEETDDYNDFESAAVKNRDSSGLKQVTYAPVTQAYDIPKYTDVSTLSPIAEQYLQGQKAQGAAGGAGRPQNGGKNTQLYTWNQDQRRKGYFFMHYPWNMLPKAYRIRPSYQFIYPPQYQNTAYSYPTNPYSDPYGVYRYLVPCGSPGGYCGQSQGYGYGGGCGGGGCGGGCGGSSAGGCGDNTGYSGNDDNEETEEGDEEGETTAGGKSGETGSINKTDPLDDLDLEDLEKLDKDKGEEKHKGVEEDVERKKSRKSH